MSNPLTARIAEQHASVTHDPLPTVLADERQLGQLFQNLIGNALKFRGLAPPRVHLSARHEGGWWVFAVRDNGIGLDPRQAARILRCFSASMPSGRVL